MVIVENILFQSTYNSSTGISNKKNDFIPFDSSREFFLYFGYSIRNR